tara:strand:+ start:4051 stop:4515 length:465 start_codon:yes stop_codon:yes gene_type:complete
MKKLIRKILREEIEKSDKHYRILDKISDHVEIPYFKSMESLTIYDKDDQEYIMKKILGDDIIININFFHKIYNTTGGVYYEEINYGIYSNFLETPTKTNKEDYNEEVFHSLARDIMDYIDPSVENSLDEFYMDKYSQLTEIEKEEIEYILYLFD